MPDPLVTVLLHTARWDFPMIGRPDTFIFTPTLESLRKQTFRDFELVIVDALHGQRGAQRGGSWFPEMASFGSGTPIRHLPFPESPWIRAGYLAISAPKNFGLIHANGELVVQIDDCSELPDPEYLERCWKAHRRGVCLASLVEHRRGGNPTTRDPRAGMMAASRQIVDVSYGYLSFPLQLALRVNGYDEGFDGAKTLEDADFARRLSLAGAHIEIDKRHWVIEHEHGDVAPEAFPVPPPSPRADRSIKCNAVHQWIVAAREGEDRIVANRRRYTDAEWAIYGPPCGLYLGHGRCAASRFPCNWLRVPGDPDRGTWIGADPNWPHIRDWQPVVDIAENWRRRREREGK